MSPVVRRIGKICLCAFCAALFLALVAGGALFWRMSQGPITIAFAEPVMKRALSFEKVGLRAEFDETILTWAGWDSALDVQVVGVEIFDARDERLGRVPRMTVGLSVRSLLRGSLAPTRLEIIDATARFVRDEAGGVAVETQGLTRERFQQLADLLIDPDRESGTLRYLRLLAVKNAQLRIEDRISGLTWAVPSADFEIRRDDAGIEGHFNGALRVAEESWGLVAEGRYSRADRQSTISISFDDIVPAVLAAQHEALSPLSLLDVPISGLITVDLAQGGALDHLFFDLAAREGRLVSETALARPLPITQVDLLGEYTDETRQLEIDRFSFASGDMTAQFEAIIDILEEDMKVIAYGELANISVKKLQTYWPDSFAVNARRWIRQNMMDGRISEAELTVNTARGEFADGLPDDAFELHFNFADVTARYLKKMPPLVDARGFGVLTPTELTVQVEYARSDEVPELTGDLRFYNLHIKGSRQADITARAEGDIRNLLHLIDNPPLGYVSRFGKTPDDVRGQAEIAARFQFPMLQDLKLADVDINVDGQLDDISLPGVLRFVRTANGELDLNLTKDQLVVDGTIDANGVPLTARWVELFGGTADNPTRYEVSGTLDDRQRSALNLPGRDILHGPIPFSLSLTGKGAAFSDGTLFADLDGAEVDLATLGWFKEPGVAGDIRARVSSSEAGFLFSQVTANAGPGRVEGAFELTERGAINRIDIDRLVVGETALSIRGERAADDVVDLTVTGPVLDVRPAIDSIFTGPPTDQELINARIDLTADRVLAHNDIVLHELTGSASHIEGWWEAVDFKARIGDEGTMTIKTARDGFERVYSIHADQAGDVARALDVYDNVYDGTLTLEGRIDDTLAGRPMKGTLKANDFSLREAPTLARILALGSLTGIADGLSGDGMSFRELAIPYAIENGVLRIEDGRLRGSSLGVTMRGWRDEQTDQLNFTGTVIPAYTLNSILGNIPIVGMILGGEDGGVFAFTYSVRGPRTDPEIRVNPLSALAPGLIRNIASPGANLSEVMMTEEDLRRGRMRAPID